MTRQTSGSFDTEVAKQQVRPVELLDLYFGNQDSADASTLHYALHDAPVEFFDPDGNAATYTAIGVKRSEVMNSMDGEQRTTTFQMENIDRQFQAFFFQNADFMRDKRVMLRTVLLDAASVAADAVKIIDGLIDSVVINEKKCAIAVHGAIGGLKFKTGRAIDRVCPYSFGDTDCARGRTVTDLTQATNDTAAAGSTKSTVVAAGLSQADGYWAIGTIVFTSGANNGYTRKVIGWTQSTKAIVLDFELPNTPSVGDAFTIKRDCDKTFNECRERFTEVDATKGNSANFGGFHTVISTINP